MNFLIKFHRMHAHRTYRKVKFIIFKFCIIIKFLYLILLDIPIFTKLQFLILLIIILSLRLLKFVGSISKAHTVPISSNNLATNIVL